MHWTARRWIGWICGLAVFAIFLVFSLSHASKNSEDRGETLPLVENSKTVCVGRFVIDLLAHTEAELTKANVDGLGIVSGLESLADFQTRLGDRESQRMANPDRLDGDGNLELVKSIETANGLVGKIFLYGRVVNEGTQANGLVIERYRYEGIAVDALVHGNSVSIDRTANAYQPARTVKIAQLISQLVPNPANKIPAESGFCIGYAYFQGLLKPDQGERITMNARLASHPDVGFTLTVAAGLEPDTKGLIVRTAESRARLASVDRARLTTLRAGRRTVGHLIGEEVAERVEESDTFALHGFWWESKGAVDDVMAPYLSFTMDAGAGEGGPVPASISDSRAILLWDRVCSSIRAFANERSAGAQHPET